MARFDDESTALGSSFLILTWTRSDKTASSSSSSEKVGPP